MKNKDLSMSLYIKFFEKSRQYLWLCFLLSLFLVACSKSDESRTVKTLRVAVLPDQSETILRNKYLPLLEHMHEYTGIPYKFLIPDSYKQLLQWISDKKVDLVKLGGATYVKAHLAVNVSPLVMRDVDGRFKSVALVRSNNPAKNLRELKGASLAFGSELSTSGHFMPRYFFQKKNIIAESFFSNIKYSGAHDRTAEWVRDGKVDVGVANSGIVHEMFLDGRLNKNDIKVLWESPPYADYVWSIQSDINKKQKTLIRDSFLHLNQKEKDKEILKKLGANYFIPAGHNDFSNLEKIILEMEQQEASK